MGTSVEVTVQWQQPHPQEPCAASGSSSTPSSTWTAPAEAAPATVGSVPAAAPAAAHREPASHTSHSGAG